MYSNHNNLTFIKKTSLFNPLKLLKFDRNDSSYSVWDLLVFSCDATGCTQTQGCQP